MNLIQKILFGLFVIALGLKIFYSIDTDKSQKSIKVGDIVKLKSVQLQFSGLETGFIWQDNRLGLLYTYDLEAFYPRGKRPDFLISKDEKPGKYFWINEITSKNKDLTNLIILSNSNYSYERKAGDEVLQGVSLSFIAPVFSPEKFLIDSQNENPIVIKLNPFRVFEHYGFIILVSTIMVIFAMILMANGSYEYCLFFIVLSFLSSYLRALQNVSLQGCNLLYFIAGIFLFSIFIKVKARSFDVLLSFRRFRYFFILLFFPLTYHIYNVKGFDVLVLVYSVLFSFIILCVVWVIITVVFRGTFLTILLYFGYPRKEVKSLKLSDYQTNLGEGLRQLPYYSYDFNLNNKIKIYGVDVSAFVMKRKQKNQPLNIKYYKTDGKGNYLFY